MSNTIKKLMSSARAGWAPEEDPFAGLRTTARDAKEQERQAAATVEALNERIRDIRAQIVTLEKDADAQETDRAQAIKDLATGKLTLGQFDQTVQAGSEGTMKRDMLVRSLEALEASLENSRSIHERARGTTAATRGKLAKELGEQALEQEIQGLQRAVALLMASHPGVSVGHPLDYLRSYMGNHYAKAFDFNTLRLMAQEILAAEIDK